jgi:S1-C subfamily serine protease
MLPPYGPVFRGRRRPRTAGVSDSVCRLRIIRQPIDILQPYMIGSLETSSSFGSGFAVRLSGTVYIVTCFHVVEDARQVEGIFDEHFGKMPLQFRCVGCNPDLDVAILAVADSTVTQDMFNATVTPLLTGDSDALRHGESVNLFGFPLGLRSMTQGIVTGRLGEPNRLQISAPSSPGNSGGPIVAMQHGRQRIIGILTSSFTRGQNFNLGCPMHEALLMMRRAVASVRQPMFERALSLNVRMSWADRHFIQSIPETMSSAVVAAINPTEVERRGLKPGDVIRRVRVATERTWFEIDSASHVRVPWSSFGPVHVSALFDRLDRNSEGTSPTVEMEIVRSKKRMQIRMNLSSSKDIFRRVYPLFEPLEFVVRAGVVVQMLNHNLVEAHEEKNNASFDGSYMQTSDFVFHSCIAITHVRPDSPFSIMYRPNSAGFVYVTSINNREVTNLADYARVWASEMKTSDIITLRTRDAQMFSAPVEAIKANETTQSEVTSRAGHVSTVERSDGIRIGQV